MSRRKNPHTWISSKDASRAIYIDFEGFKSTTPTLLGILIDQQFEQIVFDRDLNSAAKSKGMRITQLEVEVRRLAKMCNEQNRYIVAYTQHELNTIKKYTGIDISKLYRDARMIAKKWKSKCYRNSDVKCKSLKEYLKFIDYERGDYLGEKQSTARIRAVKEMLIKRGDYDSLTHVVKGKWTKLLKHNEIDCKGMKALILKASTETEKKTR